VIPLPALDAPIDFRIDQVAIVVHDLDEAMGRYHRLHGWGPWSVYEYRPPRLRETTTRGAPAEFTFAGAEAPVGAVVVELLQPQTGSSIYAEWLAEHGEGLHHLGTGLATAADADAVHGAYERLGIGTISTGWIDDVYYAYFDTRPVIHEIWTGVMESVAPSRVYP
jgi:hypothetical protein